MLVLSSVAVKSYALLEEPLITLIASVSPTAIVIDPSGLSVVGVISTVLSAGSTGVDPPSPTVRWMIPFLEY